jgi:hypothetical protein
VLEPVITDVGAQAAKQVPMARKNPPVLKSVAIHQLRALAVELKKTPTVTDIIAGARLKK